MLSSLRVINLSTKETPGFCPVNEGMFVLRTCQRNLYIDINGQLNDKLIPNSATIYSKKEGYLYLLEVICGLQSQMIGENEIVNQFKQSLREYLDTPQRKSATIKLIEKLLKDSKEIRTNYLREIGQKTYAGLVRKLFFAQGNVDRVLIIGSGKLAIDLINQFKKKCQVFISARNPKKVEQLCQEHGIEAIAWKDYAEYEKFRLIANSIGAEVVLFDREFFAHWEGQHESDGLFVDLGEPSTIRTSLGIQEGVYLLADILKQGAIKEREKLGKINAAKKAMHGLAEKRMRLFAKRKNSWHQQPTALEPEEAC